MPECHLIVHFSMMIVNDKNKALHNKKRVNRILSHGYRYHSDKSVF